MSTLFPNAKDPSRTPLLANKQVGDTGMTADDNARSAAINDDRALLDAVVGKVGITGSTDPASLDYQVRAIQTAVQSLAPGLALAIPAAGTFGPFTATHVRSSLYLVAGSAATSITKAGGSPVSLSTTDTPFALSVGDSFTVTTSGPSTILGN